VLNVVVCVFAPSPNDQFHVAPTTGALTLKARGTPVVAPAATFRNADGSVGVGVGVAGVELAATSVCALMAPAAAVTSAVSAADSVVLAIPFADVAAWAGDTVPRVVANVTITLASGTPLAFCTRAMIVAPDCVPLTGNALTVICDGTVRSTPATLG
jgi:hypothetical protein